MRTAATQPDVALYLALAVCVAAIAVMIWLLPGYWRGTNRRIDRVPAYWVWGEAMYRGLVVRSVVTITLGAASVVFATVYTVVVGRENVAAALLWSWFALFMLLLGCWVSVTLFNWPKVLVPPRMRDEPGAISDIGMRDRLLLIGFVIGFNLIFLIPLIIRR